MQNNKYLDEINEAVLRYLPAHKGQPKKMVLDIGCGSGVLAEKIQQMNYIVWGIDANEEAVKEASKYANKIIFGNLTNIPFIKNELSNTLFDYLIFADVLEHICDPWTTLREYLPFLKDNGFIIVSLPNTVVWSKRIKFLLGHFEYTDTGVFDKDHLRFFTLKSAKNLIKSSGYEIVAIDYMPYMVRALQPFIKAILLKNETTNNDNRRALMNAPAYHLYIKFIYPIEYWIGYCFKSLFAFKIIIVARKKPSSLH